MLAHLTCAEGLETVRALAENLWARRIDLARALASGALSQQDVVRHRRDVEFWGPMIHTYTLTLRLPETDLLPQNLQASAIHYDSPEIRAGQSP